MELKIWNFTSQILKIMRQFSSKIIVFPYVTA